MTAQRQSAGDQSLNIQAATINVVGVTIDEVRQIALDLFRANFYELAGLARQEADRRARELIEEFLKASAPKPTEVAQAAADPDFQCALAQAEIQYARSGDEGLRRVLVDLLLKRAESNSDDLLRIVHNEAIQTAGKLTNSQLDVLTLVFLIIHTKRLKLSGLKDFSEFIGQLELFGQNLTTSMAPYQHIEYAGCGAINFVTARTVGNAFGLSYPGLFSKGFSMEEINTSLQFQVPAEALCPSLHEEQKFQFCGLNNQATEEVLKRCGLAMDKIERILKAQRDSVLPETEIDRIVCRVHPFGARLISWWNESLAKSVRLTSVGIALAAANFTRRTNAPLDLRHWIIP